MTESDRPIGVSNSDHKDGCAAAGRAGIIQTKRSDFELQARAFTGKSLLTGAILSLIVVVIAWFNDQVLRLSPAIGNYMPALPIGLILLLAFVWNPLLGRWSRLAFSSRELAVVLGLMLMVSWIPVSGMMRYFQRSVVAPQIQSATRPYWRQLDLLGHLPSELFPLGGSAESLAMSEAIAAERSELAAGTVESATVSSQAYAAALDLAMLIPPQHWRDRDRETVRANTGRALERVKSSDPARWAGAEALLQAMPIALCHGEEAPAAWRLAHRRLDAVFTARLPAAEVTFEQVYPGMALGLPVGDETIPMSAVPWQAWIPVLVYWLPLVLLLALSLLMLSVVVHRQWSRYEQLTYPIAGVCGSLLKREPGSPVSGIVRERLFWFGLGPVFAIHLLNYLALWFPGHLPSITLHWSQWGMIAELFPTITAAGGAGSLGYGDIYFVIIGLSFFISTGVSFSIGISGMLVVLLSVQYYGATGTTVDLRSARSGACIGYVLLMFYAGRVYYWAVLKGAIGLRNAVASDDDAPVWAARFFLLAFAGFIALLVGAFQLDWLIAVVYAMTVMLFFLFIARVVCETGIPFVQAGWQPSELITSLFGVSAIGAAPLVMICYLGSVLSENPREALMPYAANALKVAEDAGTPRMKLALVGFAVIIVAIIVAFIATTWGMYNFGTSGDGWAQQAAGRRLSEAARGVGTLVETGQYAASTAAEGLDKLPLLADNVGKGREFGWITFGILTVTSVALLRFRWPGFYLHPVLFVVWDTYSTHRIWLSFLLGWIIKELVVRFGGGRVYQQLRPLFIGLIMGELLAVMMTLVTGWTYYLSTGIIPVSMSIFAS
jgi:hypothetical protein